MRRYAMVAIVIGSMLVGGVVGALLFGAVSATAQSAGSSGHEFRPGFGPGFGMREAVSDLSVAAKAIGISESDLITALRGGSSIAEVARQHGVDVQKVIDALVADSKIELAAAVKAGRITQAQANAISANLTQRITDRVNATGGMFPPGPFGPGGFDRFGPAASASLSVAAKTIGISEADLVTALRSGSSIAQVATKHGVPVQKVIDALVADAKSRLDAAVKAGRITQSQANDISASLTQRITDRVNTTGLGCDPGKGGPRVGAGFVPPDFSASA
jgi:urease accessory protein UreF